MTESEKKDIAENYIKALTNRDAALLTSITTERFAAFVLRGLIFPS